MDMLASCDHCDRKVRHGRESTYNNHRCRCDPCRAAIAAYRVRYQATDAGRAAMARYDASEKGRAKKARYYATDKGRAAKARENAASRVKYGRAYAAAALARYQATDKGRAAGAATTRRRRAQKAGAMQVIQIAGTDCALCHKPLTGSRFPDLMATTIGHEPPLSRLAELGYPPVYERPEHWGCNRAKGTRTDQELQLMKSSPDIAPSAAP